MCLSERQRRRGAKKGRKHNNCIVNRVTSSGEENGGGLYGMIASFTSGLYDFVFVFFFLQEIIFIA